MDHSDTLPPDIFAVAVGIARDLPARVQPANRDFAANVIARAIMAERERCAKIADGLRNASVPGMPAFGAGMCNAADQIAIAIRSQS